MWKKLVGGCILGTIALYVWMFISWVVLPWHCDVLESFTDEAAVSSVILENISGDGVYLSPNMCGQSNMEQHTIAMKKGPMVFAAIQKSGFNADSASPYIISFIIFLVAAFFVTYLLLQCRGIKYWHRVWFVTVFGIAAGVMTAFPDWNWWGFSFPYACIQFLDSVIGWFLAGILMAAVTKRPLVQTTK